MSGNHGGVCGELLSAYPINHYLPGLSDNVGIGEALFGFAYFGNALLMLYWIHDQARKARKGVEGAALYVIFPVYIPFMYMSFFSDVAVGLLTLFMPIDYWGANSWPMAVSAALIYALQHFVLEGIAFTMMQYGCGYQAAYRAALFAFIWGAFTFLDQLVVRRRGPSNEAYLIDMIWNVSLLVFYLSLWLVPGKFMFRRPSVVFYSKFWAIFRLADIIGISLAIFFSKVTDGAGYCTIAFGNMIVFLLCKPYVIYHTLLSDSMWWQGLGQRSPSKVSISSQDSSSTMNNSGNLHEPNDSENDAMSSAPMLTASEDSTAATVGSDYVLPGYFTSVLPFRSDSNHKAKSKSRADSYTYKRRTYRALSNPLLGMEVGFADAQELAQEVDNLRSDGRVRLLNFAYISLKKSAPLLGSGSFSKVYAGEYRGQPVAIKMLFTPDLNPEVIRRCCNEAQLLSCIQHPNIVTIYGVAVLPPSVCIVLEKCEFGSLADVLRGSEGGSNGRLKQTSPLSLSQADRMFLALGCCRGVAAMHRISETFVHRDIKSFNFLVDAQLVVKVADLELGSSSAEELGDPVNQNLRSANGGIVDLFRSSMMMSSWQAPEVIQGEEYQQSADIYSLAIVLWEIIATGEAFETSSKPRASHGFGGRYQPNRQLSGRIDISNDASMNSWQRLPFGECESQKEVRQKILNGERPFIPPNHNPKYAELITRGWQADLRLRPSAEEMSIIVESCWLDTVHGLIYETPFLVDASAVHAAATNNAILYQLSDDSSINRRRNFQPPSPQLLAALAVMQLEDKWLLLEDVGAFAITTSLPPHRIVWATKSWCLMTALLLNEVLSMDITALFQRSSEDRAMVGGVLSEAASGKPAHCVCRNSFHSKEKRGFLNSIHAFPIYAASTTVNHGNSRISQRESTIQVVPFASKETSSLLSQSSSGERSLRNSVGMTSSTLTTHSSSQQASSPLSSFLGNLRYSSSSPRTTSSLGSSDRSRIPLTHPSTLRREDDSLDRDIAYLAVQFSALKNIRI